MSHSEHVKELSLTQLDALEKKAKAIGDPVERARELLAIEVGRFRHRASLHWNSPNQSLVSAAIAGNLRERNGAEKVRAAWLAYMDARREQSEAEGSRA